MKSLGNLGMKQKKDELKHIITAPNNGAHVKNILEDIFLGPCGTFNTLRQGPCGN